jgi:hypothetical protein
MSAGGIAAGLIGAGLLRRAIDNLLFGVTAADAATYLPGAVILALVALAASAIPAQPRPRARVGESEGDALRIATSVSAVRRPRCLRAATRPRRSGRLRPTP